MKSIEMESKFEPFLEARMYLNGYTFPDSRKDQEEKWSFPLGVNIKLNWLSFCESQSTC